MKKRTAAAAVLGLVLLSSGAVGPSWAESDKKEFRGIFSLDALPGGRMGSGDDLLVPKDGLSEPKFKVGFGERLRFTTWDNAGTLDKRAGGERAYTLHRTSLWGRWRPSAALEFYIRLANESRFDIVPKSISKFTFHEIFLDSLYVKWRKPLGLPMTLTVGRQDLMLGEGFLVADGAPLDGMRSRYFNAVKVDFQLKADQTLSALFAYQPKSDTVLPVLNDQGQRLLEEPQTLLGIDYALGFGPKNSLEAYLLSLGTNYREIGVLTRTEALGGRLVFYPWEQVSVAAEAVYQFGQDLARVPFPFPYNAEGMDSRTAARSAFGGYVHADYSPEKPFPFPKTVTAGILYLSGNDPATETREDFDPFFGRWPLWSESYIFTLDIERGTAWWSNLASLFAAIKFDLTAKLKAGLTYHHLIAPELGGWASQPASAVGVEEGTGHVRGDLFIFRLDLSIIKNLSADLVWERFLPGNYYMKKSSGAAADPFYFLRFEMIYAF